MTNIPTEIKCQITRKLICQFVVCRNVKPSTDRSSAVKGRGGDLLTPPINLKLNRIKYCATQCAARSLQLNRLFFKWWGHHL